ncbi:hypothetical protein [Mycobacterium sp. URHD0025]|uniref:hypothetical protein n=1 Tax=Mycobacterium sp. URHD0025 TaxID=1298864 RepID=UPI00042224AB|nr:hypothetical protein [Mycobacterium sp. URHD0025]
MTTPIESTRRGTHSVSGMHPRSALIAGLVLAGGFAAILLAVATDGQWATVLASLAGFATAITVIAAAVISWERVVVDARSEGLVEFEVETR